MKMEELNLSTMEINLHFPPHADDRIKLNVGGKLFETTISTIKSGGPDSLLSTLCARNNINLDPVFIDRDPEIFSVLLSLLRTNHLPSTARRFSKQELVEEAFYYGIETPLRLAMAPPPLQGIDAELVATIRPTTEGFPTTFTVGSSDGSIWVAHGGQISGYDWALTPAGTVRTHLDHITSLHQVWLETAAVGSVNTAGLHFYDFSSSRLAGSVNWTDPSDPRIHRACIRSVTSSNETVFAAFECWHKENCILCVDKSTLQIISEIGRQSGNAAKTMPAGKLKFLPEFQLLLSSAVSSGAFGNCGYIRLWDPRSREVVWERNEPGSERSSRFGDSFADVDVDEELSAIFKVCSKSGDLAKADLRKLEVNDPWIYLEESNPSLRNPGGGGNSLIHCYKKQVFCSRDGGLEVWSQTPQGDEGEAEKAICKSSFRRNFVEKQSSKGIIRKIEAGGDRLFLSREGFEGIEVWESTNSSGRSLVSCD